MLYVNMALNAAIFVFLAGGVYSRVVSIEKKVDNLTVSDKTNSERISKLEGRLDYA